MNNSSVKNHSSYSEQTRISSVNTKISNSEMMLQTEFLRELNLLK